MIERLRRQNGQAMVEFALILPLFVALILIVIGFGITLSDYLRVTDIARTAAHDAAIARFSGTSNPCQAAISGAAQAAGGLKFADPAKPATCSYPQGSQNPGDPITVTVTVNSENTINNIPFLSLVLPNTLTSTATETLQ
jgi:Flp pilus assembly protein TadG